MSIVVVDELRATTLTQDFTLKADILKGIRCKAVRPMLYLHNDPAGTYTITLKQGANTINSKSLTMAEILTGTGFTSNEYHWGIFNFEFDDYSKLKKNVTYTIELTSSGYTFAESAFIGWVKPFDSDINTFTQSIVFTERPYGYEVWGHEI